MTNSMASTPEQKKDELGQVYWEYKNYEIRVHSAGMYYFHPLGMFSGRRTITIGFKAAVAGIDELLNQ